jgi:hypothetical protein
MIIKKINKTTTKTEAMKNLMIAFYCIRKYNVFPACNKWLEDNHESFIINYFENFKDYKKLSKYIVKEYDEKINVITEDQFDPKGVTRGNAVLEAAVYGDDSDAEFGTYGFGLVSLIVGALEFLNYKNIYRIYNNISDILVKRISVHEEFLGQENVKYISRVFKASLHNAINTLNDMEIDATEDRTEIIKIFKNLLTSLVVED